jgi:hypothetical protein
MNQQGNVAPAQPSMGVPMNLQKQFLVRHESANGQVYEGQFTCKKLSIRDYAQVNVRKIQLNGGYHHDPSHPGQGIDEDTDWTNQMIAQLEVSLVQQPLWFDLNKIYDLDLLLKVFKEVAQFENEVTSPQRKAAINSGSSQADSGAAGEQSGAAGSVTAVGRGEVQASLDP